MATTLPTNARGFITFMESVWDMPCEPAGDGGLHITQSPLYDEFWNARKTALKCGMRRTGTTLVNGEWAGVYRFPHDPYEGVTIGRDGNSIAPARRMYGERK